MYCDLWPYVWLVFKSGLYWRTYGIYKNENKNNANLDTKSFKKDMFVFESGFLQYNVHKYLCDNTNTTY